MPFPAARGCFCGVLGSGGHFLRFFDHACPCAGIVCGVSWGITVTHHHSRRSTMIVAMAKPLFPWDCLEDSPSLGTIKKFLASIPDAKLLEGLRQRRGRGRNDCPVHVAWGVLLLRMALRHTSFVATLAELSRNEALRQPQRSSPPTYRHRDGRRCSGLLEHLAFRGCAGPGAAPLRGETHLQQHGRGIFYAALSSATPRRLSSALSLTPIFPSAGFRRFV